MGKYEVYQDYDNMGIALNGTVIARLHIVSAHTVEGIEAMKELKQAIIHIPVSQSEVVQSAQVTHCPVCKGEPCVCLNRANDIKAVDALISDMLTDGPMSENNPFRDAFHAQQRPPLPPGFPGVVRSMDDLGRRSDDQSIRMQLDIVVDAFRDLVIALMERSK